MTTDEYLHKEKKQNWLDHEMSTFRFLKAVTEYNKMRVKHNCKSKGLPPEAWLSVANKWRPDMSDKLAVAKVKSLFKKEQVMIVADARLEQAMNDNGIDIPWLIKQRKRTLLGAIKDKKYSDANATSDKLESYAGIQVVTGSVSGETQPIDYEELDKGIEEIDVNIKPEQLEEAVDELKK